MFFVKFSSMYPFLLKVLDAGIKFLCDIVSQSGAYKPTTLLEAIDFGNVKAVRQFLSSGSDATQRDSQGNNVLHILFSKCLEEQQHVIFDLLAPHINVKEMLTTPNKSGSPALDYLCRWYFGAWQNSKPDFKLKKLLSSLLQYGFDVNTKITFFKVTLLHIACYIGDIGLVTFLLKAGAKVDALDESHFTPLDYTYPLCRVSRNGDNQIIASTREKEDEAIRQLLLKQGAKNAISDFHMPLPSMKKSLAIARKLYETKDQAAIQLSPSSLEAFHKARDIIDEIYDKRKVQVHLCENQEAVAALAKGQDYFVEATKDEKFAVTTYSKSSPEEEKTLKETLKPAQPFLAKKRLGWELLQKASSKKSIDNYLSQFQKKTFQVGESACEFYDLTKAEDYRFIINTIRSTPENLEALIAGEPSFFNTTPFFSACVLDKATRGFAGDHQRNVIFPLYLALEVPPEAIVYMGPTDIGSPYNCSTETKLRYLHFVLNRRLKMDLLEAAYQREAAEKEQTSPPPPQGVAVSLKRDPAFREPSYKNAGQIPLYSYEALLKSTHFPTTSSDSYCELIITGNKFIPKKQSLKSHLLIVEKYFLDKFNQEIFPYLRAESKSEALKTFHILNNIEKLTQGRIKLVIVDTDVLAYKSKLPVDKQIDLLEKEKEKLEFKMRVLEIKKQRLQQASKVDLNFEQSYQAAIEDLERIIKTQRGLEELLAAKEIQREKANRALVFSSLSKAEQSKSKLPALLNHSSMDAVKALTHQYDFPVVSEAPKALPSIQEELDIPKFQVS